MKKTIFSKFIATLMTGAVLISTAALGTGFTASASVNTSTYSCANVNYVKVTGLQQGNTHTMPFDPSKYESPPKDTRVVEIRTYYDTNNDGVADPGVAISTGFVVPDRNGKSVIGTAAHCVNGAFRINVVVNNVQTGLSTIYFADSYHVSQSYRSGATSAENDYALVTIQDTSVSENYFYLLTAAASRVAQIPSYYQNREVNVTYTDVLYNAITNYTQGSGFSGAPVIITYPDGTEYVTGIHTSTAYGYVDGNFVHSIMMGPKITREVTYFLAFNPQI